MVEKDKLLIDYYNKIYEISIDKIVVNEFNPRERFIESEEDELIESILSKGILNPVIVYERQKDGKYVLLDGERRFKACQKLNIKTIPAHILKREPSLLENLSMMFHIHNVRKEWTDFAISLSLRRVVEEMGKDIHNLKAADIRELKRITSLSEYKLRKYLKFHDYPEDIIKIFLDSEKKEKPSKGIDPDILTEMHRPIKQIKKQMPELIRDYPIKRIIEACIEKKASNIIETNKEFRLFSQALIAAKKGEIRRDVLKEKLIEFIEKKDVTPKDVYAATAQVTYQMKDIIAYSRDLYEEISNLDMRRLTQGEIKELKKELYKLVKIVNEKVLA